MNGYNDCFSLYLFDRDFFLLYLIFRKIRRKKITAKRLKKSFSAKAFLPCGFNNPSFKAGVTNGTPDICRALALKTNGFVILSYFIPTFLYL